MLKIIGWIGSIITAPFYYLFHFSNKIYLAYWPFIACLVIIIKAAIEVVQLNLPNSNAGFAVWIGFALYMMLYLLFFSVILGIAFTISNGLQVIIMHIYYGLSVGYMYANAWRKGISRTELEGRLAAIRTEKEMLREQAKEKKRQKKEEAFQKGFEYQWNKSKDNSTYNKTDDNRDEKRRQQDNYKTDMKNDEFNNALALFMLSPDYTLDEIKKQRKRLLKSFHPDEGDPESNQYAQRINCAYDILYKNLKTS